MPLVRMRIDILGGFEGNPMGVKRGETIDLNERSAERYVRLGYCDYVSPIAPVAPPVERAVAPEYETAKLEIPPEVAALAKPKPKPLDEPEPEPEPPSVTVTVDGVDQGPPTRGRTKTVARRAGR